jgi:hypothetical protein
MATPDPASTFVHYHGVRFYESPRALAGIVSEFLKEGFAGGSAGIVAAEPSVRAAIVAELTRQGIDVGDLEQSKRLLLLDARETMARFMVNGKPNARKFADAMCDAIRHLARSDGASTVRIFGQMVDVLWRDGERDAAIALERQWNQFAHAEVFSLLCGYTMGNFYKDTHFDDICREHSHLVSADGHSTAISPSPEGPLHSAGPRRRLV